MMPIILRTGFALGWAGGVAAGFALVAVGVPLAGAELLEGLPNWSKITVSTLVAFSTSGESMMARGTSGDVAAGRGSAIAGEVPHITPTTQIAAIR
ncbi:MAG: hypothetical protein JNN33_10350 [Rhodospirillaceae bacterium]|nr:hypothetical protein [Rhodospirillaceae bacterium]